MEQGRETKKAKSRKNSKIQRGTKNDKKKAFWKRSRGEKNYQVSERSGMEACTQS
jgi:hypothetical protein